MGQIYLPIKAKFCMQPTIIWRFKLFLHINVFFNFKIESKNMSLFAQLWKNFPKKEDVAATCSNRQKDSNKPFDDYCAIMLSECLNRSSVFVSTFKGNKCWSHGGLKHILLAEDLANGLKTAPPKGFGKMEKIAPGDFQTVLKGRAGVIFFKDYWQRGNEKFENRSGDHIDLWNNDRITGGGMFYRSIIELLGFVSDLNKSKEIWFWEVK